MAPVVLTRSGRIEGSDRRGLAVFRGIPYARAPRGGLRWRPPQPVEPWSGMRPARRFGPSAPQSPAAVWIVRRLIGAASDRQSQDCLFLNVWTPATDRRRRPVLVWIHGGAFVFGSGASAIYDASQLARRGDAVVVTINYRLGVLGFLDATRVLRGESAVANAGLRDQIAALAWVRDNIEAFGGDPQNVTVFGESAGGMSVGTLLGVPAARGLFHRAICQSGAAHNVSTPQAAARIVETFLEELGGGDLAALERAPTSRLLAAQRRTSLRLGFARGVLPWQPCVDGDLLPRPPLETIAAGLSHEVPLLVGTNRHEWRLFMLGDRRARRLDEAALHRRFARVLRDVDGQTWADRAFAVYGEGGERGLRTASERWEAFQSDRIFHHPAHRLAAAQSARTPESRAYQFAWSPPGPGRVLGACHGMEIPFVFGTLRDPIVWPLVPFAPRARRLSDVMQRAWIEFARCGDPRHEALPDWPPYGAAGATLRFAPRCRVEQAPFADGVRFWTAVEAARAGTARRPADTGAAEAARRTQPRIA